MADAGDGIASLRVENAASTEPTTHVDAEWTLNRSKRDSTVKSEPAKSPSNAQEEVTTVAQQQQRRSQRSVKSTYATATVAQREPLQRESVGKKTLPGTAVAVEKEAEPPRRMRSTRAAPVPVESSPPASPVKTEAAASMATSSAAKIPTIPAITRVASLESSTTAPPTPPRNRRPSRRQAEVDAGVAPSQRNQTHLLLGAYSASDATVLCEVVWYHIKENSHRADVLLADKSPAAIDWQRVSERLRSSHEVTLPPRECQRLWKFLSYGKDVGSEGGHAEETELLADSEPEELELTTEQINARVKVTNGAQPKAAPVGDVCEEHPKPVIEEQQTLEEPRETLRTNGIQLFPVYDQPEGVPDDWAKPFGLKQTMPLVFVAEKFLRRKAVPVAASGEAATVPTAAVSVTLSGEKLQPKPKRKRKADVGENGEPVEKKPRKKKTPPAKPPLLPRPVVPGGSTAAAGKSPASRPTSMSSSTPPPLPTPARSSFDFFQQIFRENPSVASAATSVADAFALDAAQLQVAFAKASPQVRAACEQMALDDQRRFDREQLRRRLWEKTMTSLNSSPLSSPASSVPGTPAPAPVNASASVTSQIADLPCTS